jgi:hypothetical protein
MGSPFFDFKILSARPPSASITPLTTSKPQMI